MVSSTAGDAWAGVERREAAGVCIMSCSRWCQYLNLPPDGQLQRQALMTPGS